MKKQYINKSAVKAEIEKIREHVKRLRYAVDANCIVTVRNACECLESSIDLLVNSIDTLEVKEEEEIEDLEEAASQYPSVIRTISPQWVGEIEGAFIAGAKWYKEQLKRLKEE